MEREVYKYAENASDDQSNEWGKLTDCTPNFSVHNYQFGANNNNKVNSIIELRRAEYINMNMPIIFK